ncbi:MAG: response regulator transcription factor [Pseudoscardovia radai]|nr:response regulator transcription factor [Pseudoscardovia radai]
MTDRKMAEADATADSGQVAGAGTGAGSDAGAGTEPDGAVATPRVRVAVVDDHEMFRRGVIDTIAGECNIVGQAADVDGAVRMIDETRPDVVLLDVHVPGGNGGGGAEIILRAMPGAPSTLYLALSVSDAPADVGAVIRAGARGYVTKTITAADLLASIQQVAEGYAVFSPKLAGFVLSALRPDPASLTTDGAGAGASGAGAAKSGTGASGARGAESGAGAANGADLELGIALDALGDDAEEDVSIDVLSPREQQVMRLIARGYSYKEVAAELFISVKTVETHVSVVLRKLQLSNRGELARWAAHRRIV